MCVQERSKRAGLLRVDAAGQLRVGVRLQVEVRAVPRRLRHPGEDAPDVCEVVPGLPHGPHQPARRSSAGTESRLVMNHSRFHRYISSNALLDSRGSHDSCSFPSSKLWLWCPNVCICIYHICWPQKRFRSHTIAHMRSIHSIEHSEKSRGRLSQHWSRSSPIGRSSRRQEY